VLVLDGGFGEGGGQILRSALALSVVTGQPFRIERIRANRSRPGLLRQHLAAVHAAAEVSDATLSGDTLGSQTLEFRPRTIRHGRFRFDVGSAGSATLVLQTVLLPLWKASGPSELELRGGTDNPFAPPFDFLATTYLPVLQSMGAHATVTLERHGFYPRGNGAFTAKVEPVHSWRELDLRQRGKVLAVMARAVVADLPPTIAQRELRVLREELSLPDEALITEVLPPGQGPGNIVLVHVECEAITEVFASFGARGVRAEDVARDACAQVRSYLQADVAVGPHLADQLLLPLAFAKGRFSTLPLTSHAQTNRHVIEKFVDVQVRVAARGASAVEVEVR
jgi:RNA 3'-terminal phosphate cyclase (ATP)